MRPPLFLAACILPALAACSGPLDSGEAETGDDTKVEGGVAGTLETHRDFPSELVESRRVDVWLPPSYATASSKLYPVIYMHDGQNLFDPSTSYITGVDWGVDEAMTRLIAEGAVREAIIVGVWNTSKRFEEYMPKKAIADGFINRAVEGSRPYDAGEIVSDDYLAFLAGELKPFIDNEYRTLAGAGDTFVMGSSMGGLISAYAISEYPEIFGAAACVSTHWPAGDGAVIQYLEENMPAPGRHRFYFDYGTETLDAKYEPYQLRMDEVMRAAGYVEENDWITMKFEGAEHSEPSWRERVHIPLQFLLGQ